MRNLLNVKSISTQFLVLNIQANKWHDVQNLSEYRYKAYNVFNYSLSNIFDRMETKFGCHDGIMFEQILLLSN